MTKLISFRKIDERLAEFRTGDVSLSCLDDIPGMFIFAFTQSLVEHSAIACWVDRHIFEKSGGDVVFRTGCEEDNILMFVHITKKRMYDYYSKSRTNGLVLCSLDEYCKKNLKTVWIRKINRMVSDDAALRCFEDYLATNNGVLEYENDIRTILGLPFGLTYRPHDHRMVCTTMVCDYLNSSYGYPFLISETGLPFDDSERDLAPREVNFMLPDRPFDVYRAVDFCHEHNKSPVFEDEEEKVLYGKSLGINFSFLHPINVLFITILLFVILVVVFFFLLFKFRKTGYIHG